MTATLTEAYLRRLHAFDAGDVEEFYDKAQPRDKEGQWTKVWSGTSSHPDHRGVPKATTLTKQRLSQSPEHIARQIYDADLGNGFTSSIDHEDIESYGTGGFVDTYLNGTINRKDGLQVGYFKRHLYTDDNGALVAEHQELFLDPQYQGRGIADRFNAHAISKYQKYGVDRIELEAAADVGGYAWARQGFRLNGTDQERRDFLNEQLDRTAVKFNIPVLREHTKQLHADVDVLRKAIAAGEDVQPIHIASIGEKYARYTGRDIQTNPPRDYETWPGKELLLGTQWNGVYYFDTNAAVTAAASSLAHAELRPAFRAETPVLIRYVEDLAEFACHDASCRPPTSGGTGGSKPGGTAAALDRHLPNGANPNIRYVERLRAIGISDPSNIGPEYDDAGDEKRAANFRALVPTDLDGAVRSRIQPSQLESILKVGMLTQHDTGFSAGMLNPALRDMHETAMFGAEETRPIYGYVHTTEAIGSRLDQYGPIAVVFKNEVNDRTTVTYGDSLAENNPPAPVFLTDVRKASTMRLSEASTESSMKPGYIEAQIHGQVRPEHIAKLVIDRQSASYGGYGAADSKARWDMIIGLAKQAGIPVEEATDTREFTSYGQTYDVLHFEVSTMRAIARRGETTAWADENFDPETDDVELRTPGQPATVERWQIALKFGGWTEA